MKKLALLFAGLSLFVATGCNDDDKEMEYPLVGVWQPLKEVVTTVETGEEPVSDLITYTDCQKEGRWRFNSEATGKVTKNGEIGTTPQCTILSDQNFTYTYDRSAKTIVIKFQGIVEPSNGKIITLNDTTLNLSLREETQDPTVYKTRTYTMRRIPQ
ncbi:lipocalin family protein [Chryseobacterium oranimense]|uniref:lipocalin family protein n=1 Tax=Chryseobacterium oranimense TaxID=421058 RepID=UPI0021B03FB8|nr:lipocalin family protein [Chryseobacterium oranimense]UWX60314.1 lipocalin family protein [Chryseobacterium oranimense]